MIAAILAVVVCVEPIAFLIYLRERDRREYDERSELLTRIQAPQVLNPRSLTERSISAPEPPEPDLRDLAGTMSATEIALPNGDG